MFEEVLTLRCPKSRLRVKLRGEGISPAVKVMCCNSGLCMPVQLGNTVRHWCRSCSLCVNKQAKLPVMTPSQYAKLTIAAVNKFR